MARSAYHQLARLGTHPAFRWDGLLHCPLCAEAFSRVPLYTKHYLTHEPSLADAYRWLDWRAYERYEAKALKSGDVMPEHIDEMKAAFAAERERLRAAKGGTPA